VVGPVTEQQQVGDYSLQPAAFHLGPGARGGPGFEPAQEGERVGMLYRPCRPEQARLALICARARCVACCSCWWIFEEAGATAWADRAREELARVGLRPRASSGLTATESRIAEPAAAGADDRSLAPRPSSLLSRSRGS
jgi:hypothetical protein